MLNLSLGKKTAKDISKSEDEEGEDEDAIDKTKNSKEPKKPYALQRPPNTALRQQRLKAWHPILSHSTVLPLFFGLGIFFAVLGGVMYSASLHVNEMTIQYSKCQTEAPRDGSFAVLPPKYYSYHFKDQNKIPEDQRPQWTVAEIPHLPGHENNPARFRCTLHFTVPQDLEPGVFLYYKLTNFYQNHRRYMKSMDFPQLLGNVRTAKELQDSTCKPLGQDPVTGKAVYPCGLVANSVFNDTFQSPQLLGPDQQAISTYNMSEKNIVWPDEWKHYKPTQMNASDIVPPPFWQGAEGSQFGYPTGRYEEGNIFDPTKSEHFQVWMRTAAFPTFRKLYMRNDTAVMTAGRYAIEIEDNYPVEMFGGTKSIIISTASWVGGRSFFIGGSHIGLAALCFLMGIILTIKQIVRPRRVGDSSYLSWNNPRAQR
ncbi:alkylphosphocholine resistance protein Lem3 [Malassezia pachydermatis]|uniref:Cell cycle control protein n=1 Tax=Malassezia pachydermatis TaxID=77020 RepID=A0A0N0RSR6_9BASI|nr:cell cycle control protein [Malassezia pachydermatis]KOS16529.1 cell cycle control protein [Malassezia pachydermatis]